MSTTEATLVIWGRRNSINVQKVLWCADELGLDYRRVDAGGAFGVNRSPDYLALNPNGRVPVIDDGGFVLWESNAILRYLCSRHDMGGLYPEDLRARADADRWMDWQATMAWPPLLVVFRQLVRTPPERRDPELVERHLREAEAAMGILDRHLAGRAFATGARLTMADIPLGCLAHRWFALDIPRPALPELERWHGRLRERPGFRRHVMQPLS